MSRFQFIVLWEKNDISGLLEIIQLKRATLKSPLLTFEIAIMHESFNRVFYN